jgi:hypothetical protein
MTRPEPPGPKCDKQSNGARAKYEHTIARLQIRPHYGMESDCHRLSERAFMGRQITRNYAALPRCHSRELSITAADQSHVGAPSRLPFAAIVAVTATPHWCDGHSVAFLDARHRASAMNDFASELVSENELFFNAKDLWALSHVQIRPANTTCGNLNKDLVSFKFGNGNLRYAQRLPDTLEDCRSHR